MKNNKIKIKIKKRALLMAALIGLSFGVGSAVPAQAAETLHSIERVWACNTCGSKVIASTERKIVESVPVSKCRDIYHGLDCWVCTVTFADVHTIYCPGCDKPIEQNMDNIEVKPDYHLTCHDCN